MYVPKISYMSKYAYVYACMSVCNQVRLDGVR